MDRLPWRYNLPLVRLDGDLQMPLTVVSSLTVFQGLKLLVATTALDRLGSETRMSEPTKHRHGKLHSGPLALADLRRHLLVRTTGTVQLVVTPF